MFPFYSLVLSKRSHCVTLVGQKLAMYTRSQTYNRLTCLCPPTPRIMSPHMAKSYQDLFIDFFKKCHIYIFKDFYVYGCLYVCAPYACLVHAEAKRGHRIVCNWHYRWALEVEPVSSGRAVSALNHWTISPAPWRIFRS